ncbi:unnamed protein product [Diamesa hyperborea]
MENPCDKFAVAAVNSDNKTTNHCNSYSLNGVFNSIKNSSKLSTDDQSSNQINRFNTNNNKCGRKRNINMMWEKKDAGDGDDNDAEKEKKSKGYGLNAHSSNNNNNNNKDNNDKSDENGNIKRIKFDTAQVNDGQNHERKDKMYQSYQPWILKTYGDQAKTKTITLKKQTRILCALKGLESNRPDSSKFRFWVKSKGFMMELPMEYKNQLKSQENTSDDDGCLLFVPCKSDVNNVIFKRVAVVEYFFHIIYKVHCSVGVGERRHVGQKRTYRKITENYSFLPREAVTKFLSQCHDCRKSMKTNLTLDIVDKNDHHDNILPSMMSDNQDINLVTSSSSVEQDEEIKINLVHDSAVTSAAAISANSISNEKNNNNFTSNNANSSESNPTRAVRNNHGVENFRCYAIPDDMSFDYHNIKNYYDDKTTTSSSLSNTKKYQAASPTPLRTICDDDYHDSKEMPSIDITKHNKHHNNSTNIKPITSTYLRLTRSWGIWDEDALNLDSISSPIELPEGLSLEDSYANLLKDADKLKLMLLAWNYQNSAAVRNGTSGPDLATMTNLWEQYQSALGLPTSKPSEQGSPSPTQSQEGANSPDIKEEDDGSEDESDERMDQRMDPERLKAFNMFVRLFVDENLDRMVPISKQPKEKVQAIIDSCSRQFPDFSERARKRLRTYLKSCRRNKKTKDGWENQPSRPTPAHLTSVQAEQILSLACENESMNAKRMRIGLEPISQSLTIPSSHSSETQSAPSLYTTAKSLESITTPLSISTSIANCKTSPIISTTTDSNANSMNSILSSRPIALTSSSPYDFSSAFMPKNSLSTSSFFNHNSTSSLASSGPLSGPTDLSVKRPLLPHNLNVTEAVAVKQLITGYREAAAFLMRSADELDQLLINQQ